GDHAQQRRAGARSDPDGHSPAGHGRTQRRAADENRFAKRARADSRADRARDARRQRSLSRCRLRRLHLEADRREDVPLVDRAVHREVKIVAICGSLRAQSSNLKLLRKCIEIASPSMSIEIYDRLGELPHFNPDLDVDEPPPIIRDLRDLLASAGGIIISTPEYAHGVPGSLKNALDWLVSAGELVGKPVLLLNA